MKTINLTIKTAAFCCALAILSGTAFAQICTTLGNNVPTPGVGDITNFYTPNPGFGVDEKPGGMNYYDDSGPGQTFLSPTNGVLTSVAFQMGNNSGSYSGGGSGTGPGLLTLRVYQLAGSGSTTATLIATYLSDPNFLFAREDWLRWTGIAVRLTNGVTYAYSISAGLNASGGAGNGSQMYCRVYCIPGHTYTNGSICLISAPGGASSVSYNVTANNYSQNFDLGFSDLSVLQKPLATIPSVSPATIVYGGTSFTLTEAAVGSNLHYQWQIENDGGNTSLTNIPGATSSNLVQTAVYTGNPVYYGIVVTNVNGAATSAPVNITINPASAPILDKDLSAQYPNLTASTYVGGSLTFSAAFEGTLPISYQWVTNSGSGYFPIPGATNAALTLNNLQISSIGTIQVNVTNSVGPNNSSAVTVTVLPDPPALTTNQPYAYAVYANNPLVYWRLGETDDTSVGGIPAYDYSGHGLDAQYGIHAVDNIAGPQSPAFVGFEGTNTAAQLPGPNVGGGGGYLVSPNLNINTNTVTFTAWINPTVNVAAGTVAGLVFWGDAATDIAGFGFGNAVSNGMSELSYTWNNNSGLTSGWDSNLYPPLGQWSFVALTITPIDATIYLYYIDSVSGATNLLKSVNTMSHTSEAFSGGIIRVGAHTFDDYRVFPGDIDEVAVFAHSLSEIQLKNLFSKALGAPPIVTLTNSWNGSQLTLSWPQGTLLEATNLTGPWTTNPAVSPYTVTPTGARKFYRVSN
jgi:Concanavalin A-like lectin/glucanases superfamily